MAGFIPGLSGLLIKKAVSDVDQISSVNIGFLQNINAKAGLTGILDMLALVNQDITTKENDKRLSGFTKKRRMEFLPSFKQKEVRLIEHPEKLFIEMKLGIRNIRYWTAWNNNAFNRVISSLKQFHLIDFILNMKQKKILSTVVKHNPNKPEHAFLTVEVKGIVGGQKCIKTLALSVFSDYHATAMVTAALAKIASEKNLKGVLFPFEMTNLDEILSIMDCEEIALEKKIIYFN
ncbi:hypothetical protein AAGS61_09695 [Lysinibacillus sp. KU-BSD001]|uniref:hypothetical protein n=1 Tax=Lysinibacillus sp. KU-BSD001 TaxID=3141328 RepID=UPI0036E05786